MPAPTDKNKILPGSVALNGRNLRKTVRRVEEAAADRLDLKCLICLESYIWRRPTAGRCGHIFCSDCLAQVAWMEQDCPLCRTPIFFNELLDVGLI